MPAVGRLPERSPEGDAVGRLLSVVGLLNSDLDLPSVLRWISDAARGLVDGDGAGVVLQHGDELEVLAVITDHDSDDEADRVEGVVVAYAGSGIEALDASGAGTVILQTAEFPAMDRVVNAGGLDLRTVAITRMVRRNDSTGALYVFFREPHRAVSPLDERLLEILAGFAAAAIANAEAYDAVVHQRQHERAVVNAMADGLAVIDDERIVRSWNVAATTLTGLPAAEALGKPLPFPFAAPGVGLEHQLDNGRWVEVLCSSLADNNPAETVVTFRDISAAKMVEEAKNLFLATSGHELRTPVTVIRGFARTLTSRWDELTDDQRQESVRVIADRAEGLGSLIEQVLASSHAEVGARSVDLRHLDVGPLLDAAAMDVRSLSGRHTVTVEVPPDLPGVLADDQALRTVLGHLVDNAVQYSPAGGVIALSAGAVPGAGVVCIRVDDEGIGVASEDRERVFERFFQADGGDTRHHGGFGLGLYIVRRLVQAHEGSVVIMRRPDGRPGSRVEVSLPVDTSLGDPLSNRG